MRSSARRVGIAFLLVAVCGWALPATATTYTTVFSETFDGTTLPTTLTYSVDSQVSWSINGANQLLCDYAGAPPNATVSAPTNDGFASPGDIVIYSLDAGTPQGSSAGSYNVGMTFGGYIALFHPGYSSVPGAFRIEGGFSQGTMSMGFVPATGVMHHMEVVTQPVGSALAVDVSITGLGTDASMHTFEYSFLDTSPNLSTGRFGGRRSGGGNTLSDAFFDNLEVEVSPEPATMAMLAGGVLALVRRRRTR